MGLTARGLRYRNSSSSSWGSGCSGGLGIEVMIPYMEILRWVGARLRRTGRTRTTEVGKSALGAEKAAEEEDARGPGDPVGSHVAAHCM